MRVGLDEGCLSVHSLLKLLDVFHDVLLDQGVQGLAVFLDLTDSLDDLLLKYVYSLSHLHRVGLKVPDLASVLVEVLKDLSKVNLSNRRPSSVDRYIQ